MLEEVLMKTAKTPLMHIFQHVIMLFMIGTSFYGLIFIFFICKGSFDMLLKVNVLFKAFEDNDSGIDL